MGDGVVGDGFVGDSFVALEKIAECPCVCHRLNLVGVFNPVSVFDVDLAAYHTLFFWGLTVLLVD